MLKTVDLGCLRVADGGGGLGRSPEGAEAEQQGQEVQVTPE